MGSHVESLHFLFVIVLPLSPLQRLKGNFGKRNISEISTGVINVRGRFLVSCACTNPAQ